MSSKQQQSKLSKQLDQIYTQKERLIATLIGINVLFYTVVILTFIFDN
jgi:lambda repressor-like predicted transcriptional regulator